MNIGIIGVNFRSADLFFREKLAQSLEKASPLLINYDYAQVVLSTCNRFEIYFSSENLTETHSRLLEKFRAEFKADCGFKLYAYFGKDCFYHLAKVTAGLDSAILAETEIQGQVKRSYLKAQSESLTKELHFVFQKSLRIGKKIRSQIKLEPETPNLINTLTNLIQNLLTLYKKPKILFVGTSEVNLKMIRQMNKELFDIYICSRSFSRGEERAEQLQVKSVAWAELSKWEEYQGIILATRIPHYIIDKQTTQTHSKKIILDLSVPRNVHPQLGDCQGIQLLNIDQINKLVRRYRKLNGLDLSDLDKHIQDSILNLHNLFKVKNISIEKVRSVG